MTNDGTTPRRPLIIGYGNSLRRDDGAGWSVAQYLMDDPRSAGIDVIAAIQLTPDLAVDIHNAAAVVFVDACVTVKPGRWRASPVEVKSGDGPGAHRDRRMSSHACTPEALLTLARELYGTAAPAALIKVGVASLLRGEHLTAPVAAAVPSVAALALRLALDMPPIPVAAAAAGAAAAPQPSQPSSCAVPSIKPRPGESTPSVAAN